MKKSKFSEEQIVRILKEVEAGAKVGETCRKHGISEPTYYVWKNKYAGMDVSQLRHLKDVEVELARLKRMYAELALEHHALKDVLSRKGCGEKGSGSFFDLQSLVRPAATSDP
jgi:putative transposase